LKYKWLFLCEKLLDLRILSPLQTEFDGSENLWEITTATNIIDLFYQIVDKRVLHSAQRGRRKKKDI
jgi:hypothetical protein